MTDSVLGSKPSSDSGVNEGPSAGKYRALQLACVGGALTHAIAVLTIIHLYREGRLDHFSLVRLMHFIPNNLIFWRFACISAALSSISSLVLFVAIRDVIVVRHSMLLTIALLITVIGVSNDLQAQSSLLVLFSDLALQLHGGATAISKQAVLMESWATLNRAATQSLVLATPLYAGAGLVLAGSIIVGRGMPKWLGWCAIPVWVAGLVATLLTFTGAMTLAVIVLFSSSIAFILWTIAIAVTIDGYASPDRGEK